MKNFIGFGCALLVCALAAPNVNAAAVHLNDWGFNVDGTLTENPAALPGNINGGGFNFSTGLGSVTVSGLAVGTHNVLAYFDHDIDVALNGPFNEQAKTVGGLSTGYTYQLDDPNSGTIFANFESNSLDNFNHVPLAGPPGPNNPQCCDVAMAQGILFDVPVGFTGNVLFRVGTTAAGLFYLQQTDPDSSASIFFDASSSLTPVGDGGGVPEPATWMGLLSGLGVVVAARRFRI